MFDFLVVVTLLSQTAQNVAMMRSSGSPKSGGSFMAQVEIKRVNEACVMIWMRFTRPRCEFFVDGKIN